MIYIKANSKIKCLSRNDSGVTQVVGGLVALLLMIIVGVMIFWEVSDSIDLPNDDANTSRDATTDMATTVFGLLPIIGLVVVAGIIIGVIMGFGKGAGGL